MRSPEKYRGALPGTWSPGSAKQPALRKSGRSRILPGQGCGVHAGPSLKLGAHDLGALGAVRQTGVGHAEGHGLSRLLGDYGRERPASHHCVDRAVHIAANPLLAPNGQVHDHGRREPLWRVVAANAVFRVQAIELLRNAGPERTDPVVPARRGIICRLRYCVASLKTDVVRRALLEANLHGVVPGTGFLQHQPFKVAGELRVLVQKISQGQRRLAVVRIWFVEARMGSGRRARGIEHGIKRVAHLRLEKVAYAAICQASSVRRSDSSRNLGQQCRRDVIAVVGAGPG